MEKTIELDCPPGNPRPGDLIMGVVQGTALEALTTPDNAVSRLFGNWTWAYPTISDEAWKQIQEVTRPRVTALYHSGRIRYGSW